MDGLIEHRCGVWIPANVVLCPSCFGEVRDGAGAVIGPATPQPPAADHALAPDEPPSPVGALCPVSWCSAELPPQATQCPRCGRARDPVPSAAASLTVVLPHGERVPFSLGDRLLLGRAVPDPAISRALIALDAVSREHAELRWSAAGITVTDRNSTNGTFVDGHPVDPTVTHPVGPLSIRLGLTVTVRLEPGE